MSGFNVFPNELEQVISLCPGVVECAVIAVPCPVLGERVHAFVVTDDGAATADAVRAWCAGRLSDYKVPETVTLQSEPLPRNANGKVMKRVLREQQAAAAGPGG